jgi:hypothetical protein
MVAQECGVPVRNSLANWIGKTVNKYDIPGNKARHADGLFSALLQKGHL